MSVLTRARWVKTSGQSPSVAVNVAGDELSFVHKLHGLGRRPVDEFRAELDRDRRARIAEGVDASAYPVPRLEDDGGYACFGEPAGCGEPRDSSTDDDDVNAF